MTIRFTLAALALALSGAARAEPVSSPVPVSPPAPVKVMIVTMFAPEAAAWSGHRDLGRAIPVPGLPRADPAVHCGADGVCLVTTGMGYANVAASLAALAYSRQFDLHQTYWLVAGIAGIDPGAGTLGTAAWARYLVDWGLQWELDARDAPGDWLGGFLGINTHAPGEKPALDYGTEMFRLNEALLQRALALSAGVVLADSPEAQAARARYPAAPANQPPTVVQCDSLSSDTWFAGTRLNARAGAWMALMTDGKGRYCTSQQEDNATAAVLARAGTAGLVDPERVAVLRAGSDFVAPPPGVTSADALVHYQAEGGFGPALTNLYRAGAPLVDDIAQHWSAWQAGVPAR